MLCVARGSYDWKSAPCLTECSVYRAVDYSWMTLNARQRSDASARDTLAAYRTARRGCTMGLFRHGDDAPSGHRFQMREKLLAVAIDDMGRE